MLILVVLGVVVLDVAAAVVVGVVVFEVDVVGVLLVLQAAKTGSASNKIAKKPKSNFFFIIPPPI